VPDDGEIRVHMWRQTDERKVWYEWMVDVYAHVSDDTVGQGLSQGHGPGKGKDKDKDKGKGKGHEGTRRKKVKIGGSELHSSIKEACLM
jgi:protein arginine N-methyltransferase 5